MRKPAARLVACALALLAGSSLVPAHAAGSQTVRGEVELPTSERGCEGLAVALFHSVTGMGDAFVHRFRVNQRTHGARFTLGWTQVTASVVSDAPAAVDLDISFLDARGAVIKAFETRGLEPETGKVPHGAVTGSVCMFAGAQATFLYRAGARSG